MSSAAARVRAVLTRSPRATAVAAVAAVAMVTMLLAGLLAAGGDPAAGGPAPQATAAEEQSSPVREPRTTVSPRESASTLAALPTTTDGPRLQLPAIGVDAPVVPVSLQEGGVLDPPAEVSEVGWWDGSAEAGDDAGQTVLTGHTVHDGGGVMDDLDQLRPGDAVRLTDEEGHTDYRVTEVVTWTKAELAANAVEAFGQDRHHGRLVMVTCEDWQGDDYASNVVVFAAPVEPTTDRL